MLLNQAVIGWHSYNLIVQIAEHAPVELKLQHCDKWIDIIMSSLNTGKDDMIFWEYTSRHH